MNTFLFYRKVSQGVGQDFGTNLSDFGEKNTYVDDFLVTFTLFSTNLIDIILD